MFISKLDSTKNVYGGNKPKIIFPTVEYVFICHSDTRWCAHVWAKFCCTENWTFGLEQMSSWTSAAVFVAVKSVNLLLQHSPFYKGAEKIPDSPT